MKAAIEWRASFLSIPDFASAFESEQIECQFSELQKNLGQIASVRLSIK